jgi:hypothetical protein
VPKHSDGPPSGGHRYGGLEAFRSGLPPEAANPRRPRTDAEIKAAKSLADFTDYFGRVKSINRPLPRTKGVSPLRAIVQKKMEESNKEKFVRAAKLSENGDTKIWLFRNGPYSILVKERPWGYSRSLVYRNSRAKQCFHFDRIIYIEFIEGDLPSSITAR